MSYLINQCIKNQFWKKTGVYCCTNGMKFWILNTPIPCKVSCFTNTSMICTLSLFKSHFLEVVFYSRMIKKQKFKITESFWGLLLFSVYVVCVFTIFFLIISLASPFSRKAVLKKDNKVFLQLNNLLKWFELPIKVKLTLSHYLLFYH